MIGVKIWPLQIVQTNQDLIKVFEFLSQRMRIRVYKTLGTSIIYNPMSSPFHITLRYTYRVRGIFVEHALHLKNHETCLNKRTRIEAIECMGV